MTDNELLMQIHRDVRSTREGQIKLTAKVEDLTGDVAKLYATVIEGEGSARPLKGRVDSLEDTVESLKKKASLPPVEPYRPQMHSETTGPIAVVQPNGYRLKRWQIVAGVLGVLITTAGGVLIAIYTQ